MPERPAICLCEYPYPMLILPWPSGVEIAVQAGGDACTWRSVEGLFLPLPIRQIDNRQENDLTTLAQHLEALHPGCRERPITKEDADRIDSAFAVCAVPILVNRARLQESTEAWLLVRIREAEAVNGYDEPSDFAGMEAALTWQNCD
jgi:Family of unknown function (DUF6210)